MLTERLNDTPLLTKEDVGEIFKRAYASFEDYIPRESKANPHCLVKVEVFYHLLTLATMRHIAAQAMRIPSAN